MKYLSSKSYQQEMERVKRHNQQVELRNNLKHEKDKYKKKVHIETSKILAIYLFILLNAIVIYAMVAMWKFADLTYLGVLITDIAAQILIYGIYCLKAYKAKKSEEEIRLERDKLTDVLAAGAESSEPVPLTTGTVETPSNNQDIIY